MAADRSRKYLTEYMGQEAGDNAATGGIAGGAKISRSTLEEDARQTTLRGHGTPEERFWQRQQGQAETIAIGKKYIEKVCTVTPSQRILANIVSPLPKCLRSLKRNYND
jgi:hypothetical protein